MLATSGNDPFQGAHISEVSTPGEYDVLVTSKHIVGGVQFYPAVAGNVGADPGVGCIGSDKFGLPFAWMRAEVTAHVTAG